MAATILANLYVWIWLILVVVFIIAELATVGLLTIWFAAGALAAMLMAMIGAPLWVQIFIFLAVSVALLLLTRPWARKYINNRTIKTNVDRNIGQRAIVTEPVNNLSHSGRAVVLGQDWSICTEDDSETIDAGELVEVLRVSGVKLIVRKVKEK